MFDTKHFSIVRRKQHDRVIVLYWKHALPLLSQTVGYQEICCLLHPCKIPSVLFF